MTKISIIILLLLFVFFLIIINTYYSNGCLPENSNNTDQDVSNTATVAILLTMCYRNYEKDTYKKELYDSCISGWIKEKKTIFIVESSMYKFPDSLKSDNIHICSFDIEYNGDSSNMESRSILHALEYFEKQLKDYTHILKITGRYFIPTIYEHLNISNNIDFIFQHSNTPIIRSQNSEIFGFKKELGIKVFNTIINKSYIMEKYLYTIYNPDNSLCNYKYIILPPIENINNVKRGGDGLVVNPL